MIRKTILTLLAAVCPFVVSCTRSSAHPRYVVLSYRENPTGCIGCPKFQVDFSEGGQVDFHGLAGCAAPGVQHYRIPESEFQNLLRAFQQADFFSIPRMDVTRVVFDATVITVTYKDERRIHETVDNVRQLPRLTELEKRLRTVANVDCFLKPSVGLYQRLLREGWDVNTLGEDHENALFSAVLFKDLDSVRFLLQHGAKVSDRALVLSAFSRDPALVKLLLDSAHAGPNTAAFKELFANAAGRSVEITRLLLNKGAQVNSRDSAGKTPLMEAVSGGLLDNAVLLVAKGADVNATDSTGRSALWYAAWQLNSGFIALLVQHGAKISAQDVSGQTALMHASDLCFYWNIKPLLDAGADPTITDKEGHTAAQRLLASYDQKCKTSRKLFESAGSTPIASNERSSHR